MIAILAVAALPAAVGIGRAVDLRMAGPTIIAAPAPAATASVPEPPPPTTSSAGDPPGTDSLEQAAGLGEDKYGDTFAAMVEQPHGSFIIYTTTPGNRAFRAAVANFNTKHLPVRFVKSKFSYNQLQAIQNALWRQLKPLARDGVELVESGPEQPYNSIDVELLRPTPTDLARIEASSLVPTNLTPVTKANYLDAARAVVAVVAGPDYTIDRAYGTPIHG